MGSAAGAAARPNAPEAAPQHPLSDLLNPDGTVNLNSGFSGSLDPAGWTMQTRANGPSRFVSGAAPLAPGDENWDDRFSQRGVDNTIYALAVSGGLLYAGGSFITAGGDPPAASRPGMAAPGPPSAAG